MGGPFYPRKRPAVQLCATSANVSPVRSANPSVRFLIFRGGESDKSNKKQQNGRTTERRSLKDFGVMFVAALIIGGVLLLETWFVKSENAASIPSRN
jgi:hypothetical protein